MLLRNKILFDISRVLNNYCDCKTASTHTTRMLKCTLDPFKTGYCLIFLMCLLVIFFKLIINFSRTTLEISEYSWYYIYIYIYIYMYIYICFFFICFYIVIMFIWIYTYNIYHINNNKSPEVRGRL